LQEKVDEGYEPTDKEITDYAEWLGMDPEKDADLLWIARQGLKTPLPKPWQPCESASGDIFYFNPESGESKWDHPCDDELRQLYAAEKAKKGGANSGESKDKTLKAENAARTSTCTSASAKEVAEEDSLSLEVLEEKPKVTKLEKSSESLSLHEEEEALVSLKETEVSSLSLEEKPEKKAEEKPKEKEACFEVEEVEVEKVESISSFGDEETPPVAAEDLTGKALPPPPADSDDLKECKQTEGGDSAGLAPLAPLAPLGPLPPLSLPPSSLTPGTSDSLPASTATKGKEGLEDVLGSPLDLLAGLSLSRPSRNQEALKLSKEEHVPERPTRPPPSKPRPMPPKPPSLECTEEEGGSAPLESPATRPPPEEMLTPPAPPAAVHQTQKSEDGTDQSPAEEPGLDSQSPPTPQLASILAAELRPEEEDGKDQMSLWPNEDVKEGGIAKVPKTSIPVPSPAKKDMQESPGSLEISSLSAVLEQSNVCAGDVGDCSMVEELERMGEGTSAGDQLSPIDIMKEPYATQQTTVTELRKLREQLESKESECEKLRLEAKTKEDRRTTEILELEARAASTAPFSREPDAVSRGSHPVPAGQDVHSGESGSIGAKALVEVQDLMGSGGFRDTLKLRWDAGPPAQQVSVPDLGATVSASSPAAINTAMAGVAAHLRVEMLEAELNALAARVKSMEAGQQNDCSKPQDDAKLRKEDIINEDKKATPSLAAHAEVGEINRLRWQVRELQEEMAGLERKLQDSRHEVSLEQASHSNTQAALRESQRQVQQLQSQLKFRDGEVARMTNEVQRCNSELAAHAAEVQQLQSLLKAREAELAQAKMKLATQAFAHRFEPCDRLRLLRDKDNLQEAKVAHRQNFGTPSSAGSSTASIREVKYLELSEDQGDPAAQAEGTPSRKLSSTGGIGNLGGMQRCGSSAKLCQDMSEALRSRRRELRKQHVELEEDRKKWRSEARRLKKSRSASEGPQFESMSRSRATLDARATSLNKAIGEYRAMQRLLTSTALKAAPAGGA